MVTKDRGMELENTLGQQVRRTGSLSPRQARPCGVYTVACRCREADDRFRIRLRAAYLGYIPPVECARRGRKRGQAGASADSASPYGFSQA